MADYLIKDTTLTNIADAIRAKKSSTNTYTPAEMATAISSIQTGGDIPEEAFVISGNCSYRFANGGWDWFIEQYGNRITTENIGNAVSMFDGCLVSEIPFDINFDTSTFNDTQAIFSGCQNLINLPILNNFKVYNISNMFKSCIRLRTIPEDYASTWNWNYLESQTGAYTGNQNGMFYGCCSLRSILIDLIIHGNPYMSYFFNYFNNGFYSCCVLDELINLPITYINATWTSNAFVNTFNDCTRLKNMTFTKNEDGTPIIVKWKSQVIDLSQIVGYTSSKGVILNYNSGITADKEVTDDATYQALKNDPDWFTTKVEYSRYNHDSAVATINSLPDTSAYLASAGGTNTIKFKGAAGSATDGGAISSLTPDEIAVATSRGWTVSLV